MGCGCNKKSGAVKMTHVSSEPAKAITYDEPNDSSTPINSTAHPDTPKPGNCIGKLDQLRVLETKVVELFNKFKNEGTSQTYLDKQIKLREWMSVINDHCPDADELLELSNSVNADYAKYM